MLSRIGKYYHFTNTEVVNSYADVFHDMLWYLMKETRINRLVSRDSFREFLTRYFLIAEIDLDQAASEFIDHGMLLEGTITDKSFSFGMRDLISFAGFSCSDFLYNIYGTLDEFCNSYVHRPLNPKIEVAVNGANVIMTTDTFMIACLDLITLGEVGSLSIRFRKNLTTLPDEYLQKASGFAGYVVSLIPESVFHEMNKRSPWLKEGHKEYYEISKRVKLDIFAILTDKQLFEIYKYFMKEEDLEKYKKTDLDNPDVIGDLSYYNNHIAFAYGVKHGYIKRSHEVPDNHLDYDPLFDIDVDQLMGPDGEVYSTEDIYCDWSMDDWIHLVP